MSVRGGIGLGIEVRVLGVCVDYGVGKKFVRGNGMMVKRIGGGCVVVEVWLVGEVY
jgi:hypothetical protein